MPFVSRKSLFTLTLLAVAAVLAAAAFVWSGLYNVGADDAHTPPVYAVLETLREESIEHHARDIEVPPLDDPALIRSGAGNYAAMCTGCHLAPGVEATELSRGLYPVPPNLTRQPAGDPGQDFWVIKHGIKASGMPAWGRSMEDEYIWGMVAFLQQLPELDAAGYSALVASSGGHSHGGGETGDDHHGAGPDHHAGMEDQAAMGDTAAAQASSTTGTTHVHADGQAHVHDAPAAPVRETPTAPAEVEPAATAPAEPDTSASPPPAPETIPEPAPETPPQDHTDHDH